MAYEKALPGLDDRIVRMAEREQAYRHESAILRARGGLDLARRGQRYALVAAGLAFIGSFILIALGHDVAGTTLGGSTIVALAVAFIGGRVISARKASDTQQEDGEDEEGMNPA